MHKITNYSNKNKGGTLLSLSIILVWVHIRKFHTKFEAKQIKFKRSQKCDIPRVIVTH